MRAGAYELEHRKDVPARVVVTEYVDVANAFVDREETGMVNAVLDQLARRFRADEFSHGVRMSRSSGAFEMRARSRKGTRRRVAMSRARLTRIARISWGSTDRTPSVFAGRTPRAYPFLRKRIAAAHGSRACGERAVPR